MSRSRNLNTLGGKLSSSVVPRRGTSGLWSVSIRICLPMAQVESFRKVKEELTKPTVLALYNPNAKTKIRADASAYGLGAVLLQYHDRDRETLLAD